MPASHRIVVPVEWGDTDAAGIVFYPNYYRWFDRAAHALLRAIGFAPDELLRRGCVVPLIDSGARFLAPIVYGDEVEIESTVAEMRTRTFRLEHRVRRGSELVAEGFEVRVWARAGVGSPPEIRMEAIPDEVRVRLLDAPGAR